MNFRLTLIAASLSAMFIGPALASGPVNPVNPLMGEFKGDVSPQASNDIMRQLDAKRAAAGHGAEHGFKLAQQHPGVAGTTIHRVDHTYKNIRILGSESVVVTNDRDTMVSESMSERRHGLGQGVNSLTGTAGVSMDVEPKLSAADAIAQVVKSIAPNGQHIYKPQAELVINPIVKSVRIASAVNKTDAQLNAMDLEQHVTGHELAYLVKTRMNNGGRSVYMDTIISAKDGRVLQQWNAMQNVTATGKSQYNGTVALSTTQSGTAFKMVDPLRGINGPFGGMAITSVAGGVAVPGTLYSDADNIWGDGINSLLNGAANSANGQTVVADAMYALQKTYDMLNNTLGWKSLDGKNTGSYIAVHFWESRDKGDNAFFDPGCKCMKLGDGNTVFRNLSSLDIVGHEMSHGVISATSNLNYIGESGALNESGADLGGEMVEAYAKAGGTGSIIPATGNDWLVGQGVVVAGGPLRYMYKPSKDGRSPDAWSSTIGSLDVHLSSGPNNRMFYFLSRGSSATVGSDYRSAYLTKSPLAMTGIGNDKAYRIWFKALTTKFTSTTNYADARNKMLLAAQELYGVGSKEAIAVTRAYAAINVGADINETTVPPGSELIVNGSFESGTSPWVGTTGAIGTFTGQTPSDGTRYLWLGGNGTASTESLYQTVSIPATAPTANLTFAMHIDTAETGTTAYDRLTVSVRSSTGAVLRTLATYSNANAATGYVLRSFDLSAYKGQTVQIHFTETEDASLQTSFVIDKVSLK